jgi:hypothetical protein
MERNVNFETAMADGFRIDERLVAAVGCAALKCDYRLANPDYFDASLNAQYIPSNLRAYLAAVAEKERGTTAAQRLEREQMSGLLLGIGSVAYGLAESAYILATGQNFLGEDENRWWGAAGIATLGLGRVGKSLYQLRHIDNIGEVLVVNGKNLNPNWVNEAGELTWRNPLSNVIERVPNGNVVHVDHVFPRQAATDMEGWNLLSKAEQERLLNQPINLQLMLASANCSKGCRVELPQGQSWQTWLGRPVNPQYRQYLADEQERVRLEIIRAIQIRQGLPPGN